MSYCSYCSLISFMFLARIMNDKEASVFLFGISLINIVLFILGK